MVVLGGGLFLMSEFPLYVEPRAAEIGFVSAQRREQSLVVPLLCEEGKN